ncbi:MAG: hypothetical protein QM695_02670 [Micropruina sp.]
MTLYLRKESTDLKIPESSVLGALNMTIRSLGVRGNFQLVQDEVRRFPALMVQGDTLLCLIEELEEEAPGSYALRTAQSWLVAYEEMMHERGMELPYRC